MTFTRKILIAVFGFFAVLLVVAALLPDHYRVERSIVIDAPADVVFAEVIDFKTREKWDPWVATDSTAVTEYSLRRGYIGSVWRWHGQKIGEGEIEITAVKPPESFEAKLRFLKPNRMESSILWRFEPVANGTKCTWVISGHLDYPANRIFGLFIDDILGGSMERGLSNLLENRNP